MAESVHYSFDQLRLFCCDAFEKFGFTREDAGRITDVLLLADLYGIESHGSQRLAMYYQCIQNKTVHVDAKPEIVFETPVSAVIDGHAGMGQLISIFAENLAIEKAKKTGMAFVTVRNSNHFGIAGYYSKMALDAGMIGIAVTNSESIMVHTHSRQAILGSNPLAFAMPAEPCPFWFDAATTVVPKGKLELYNKKGAPLTPGWAVDETGEICTDAEKVLDCIVDKENGGGILPLGGASEETGSHKGYGYSMIVELLSAITSGGCTSNHHEWTPGKGEGTCHAFIVIDPAIFGDPQAQKAHLSAFLHELRTAKRRDENIRIYTHGEKEQEMYQYRLQHGIDVDINTVGEMKSMCDYLGMDSKKYLGDVDTSHTKIGAYEKAYQKK